MLRAGQIWQLRDQSHRVEIVHVTRVRSGLGKYDVRIYSHGYRCGLHPDYPDISLGDRDTIYTAYMGSTAWWFHQTPNHPEGVDLITLLWDPKAYHG